MTIPAALPTFVQIPGNSSATLFAAPMKCFQASDVKVGFITGGAYALQLAGYSIQNVDANGGFQVLFATAPPTGTTVDIRTVTPQTQMTEFANLGSYLPENSTEAFDRITRIVQDLFRLAYQFGIHGPDTEGTPWPTLPGPAARAGSALIFDPTTGLPTIGLLSAVTFTQAIWDGFLAASTQVAAAVGDVLYPVIANESTMTVTNQLYPVGHLFRYGVVADAAVDGSAGTDNAAIVSLAFAMSKAHGIPITAPPGNIGISNVIQGGGATLITAGIHKTQFIVLAGTTGTVWTDDGSAAKINIYGGLAIYGANNAGVTAGVSFGHNGTAYGTEAYIDQLWVRDLPNAKGIDINANIGEIGFLIDQNTQGMSVTGTGTKVLFAECVGASGFTVAGFSHAVNLGDVSVGLLEIEAPATGVVPLCYSGNARVEYPVFSFGPGTTHDHVETIGSSATTVQTNAPQYYFTQGGAYNSGTAYVISNTANSGGVLYYCIAPTTGNAPPNATYWQIAPNITGAADIYDVGTTLYYGGLCEGGSHLSEGPRVLAKGGAMGLLSVGSQTKGRQAMAGTTATVTFAIRMPNTTYNVQLTGNSTGGPFWPSSKTQTGMTINAASSYTGNVDWKVEP